MERNKALEEYVSQFGELPPLFMMATYDSEFYQKKMSDAVKMGTPITIEDLNGIEGVDVAYGNGKDPKEAFKSFKEPKK